LRQLARPRGGARAYKANMANHPDVLIVGGGVIGLSAAYFLAREGARVALVDKGDFGQEASWAGAGIIPPGDPTAARTAYEKFRAASAALLPELSAELRERTGIDNGYVRCGGLEVLRAGDDPDAEWRGEGASCELVEGREALHRLEPALSPAVTRACHLPGLAQLRNPRHLKALDAACRQLGVTMLPGRPVQGFDAARGRASAARTDVGPLPAGQFLVAAGPWSDPLLEGFGWRPVVRPVRGQIVLLNPGRPLFRCVLMQGARYLVPRTDGLVLAGSTEEDVGFDRRTTAAGVAELLGLAVALVPELAGAHMERCWAGLRPGSPDGLPFIGRVPGTENVFVAAGHFRAGIQLSAATALALKELILGQRPSLSLEPFAPGRFSR